MQRHREIAAAPNRSASETVSVISDLVRDTLVASPKLDTTEIDEALSEARPALLALVAGGHLDRHAVVLVAAVLHLSVKTVSGDGALTLEENLAIVPGAATATKWTLYLPTPEPLDEMARATADRHPRLSAEEPPSDTDEDTVSRASLDLEALARRSE
jgi:hypothetical protein